MRSKSLVLAVMMFAPVVFAGTASTTNTNNIQATVAPKCTIGTFAINFGAYDPFSASHLDQTGTITVNCTKGTSGDISLDNGQYFQSGNRRMSAGSGNFLIYEIYREAGRSSVWNNSNTVTVGPAASKNTALTATAYGRIVAGQDASASGSTYQDTLVATVTF